MNWLHFTKLMVTFNTSAFQTITAVMKGTCACFDKDADGEDDDGEEAEQDELIYEVSPMVVALRLARLPLELEAVGSIPAHMNVARGP